MISFFILRSSLKQEESARKDSPSEERIHSSAASTRHSLSSGDHDRASEICSEKIKPKDDTQLRDRTPRSKANAPPNQVKASSPSTNGQQFLDVSGWVQMQTIWVWD